MNLTFQIRTDSLKFWSRGIVFLSFILIVGTGCERREASSISSITVHGITLSELEVTEILKLSPLSPIPSSPTNAFADRSDAALLGQFLFFDMRLSGNGKVSCATCHQSALDWTDEKALSEGVGRVSRNAPTLYNVAYNRWYFWDGRKDSLWSQSLGPIEAPLEMNGNRLRVYRLVSGEEELRLAYEKMFGSIPGLEADPTVMDARPIPDNPTHPMHVAWESLSEEDQDRVNRLFSNVGKTIEAFERKIISDHSPFDRFVAGIRDNDLDAINTIAPAALRGLRLFIGRGQCTLCHLGPNFTDREFHNIGLDRGDLDLDVGRFKGADNVRNDEFNGFGRYSDDRSLTANIPLNYVAQKPNNLGEFKTPTLRNVSKTGPYMHSGRFASLLEVTAFYSALDQIPAVGHREESLAPLSLTEGEQSDLAAFLETLTGTPLDESLLSQPSLQAK